VLVITCTQVTNTVDCVVNLPVHKLQILVNVLVITSTQVTDTGDFVVKYQYTRHKYWCLCC
jgi:hypothetical protein